MMGRIMRYGGENNHHFALREFKVLAHYHIDCKVPNMSPKKSRDLGKNPKQKKHDLTIWQRSNMIVMLTFSVGCLLTFVRLRR